jgi:hypothetical protein
MLPASVSLSERLDLVLRGRRWRGALLVTVLLGGSSCDPKVIVGERPSGEPPAPGGGGSAGAPQEPSEPENTLPWAAGHEDGTLDEWVADGFGWSNAEGSTTLEVVSERARGGERSVLVSIAPPDGELAQVFLARDVPEEEATCGAWYLLEETPDANHLVVMKLSSGASLDRFDVDLHAPGGVAPRLRLYEHEVGWITESATVPFPIGRWVHVEVSIRTARGGVPRLTVFQDGELLFDLDGYDTVPAAPFPCMVGAAARWVTPAPFRVFIDDVTVTRGLRVQAP